MAHYHVAVIPVGKVTAEEAEAVLTRASRALRQPMELRDSLPVPQGVEDTTRRQFRAALLIQRLQGRLPQLGPGRWVGAESGESGTAAKAAQADAHIFLTDVDLFTDKTDGVFAAFNSRVGMGLISVRRLREAFYRRTSDPAKQRTRLVKELLRVAGRLRGLKQCANPQCVLAASKQLVDVDVKDESYCRVCSEWMFQGTGHI